MTSHRRLRRIVLLCGAVPTLLVATLSLYRPPSLTGLEYSVYDTLIRDLPSRAPSDRIVIIDVDEPSLAAIGQWPWRRDVIGQLIDKVRDLGAAVVALDIVFAEPDRFTGSTVTPD